MADEKIQTVTGPVLASDIDITLSHEHLHVNMSKLFKPPKGRSVGKDKLPLTMENMGWIRQNPISNIGNLVMTDEREALIEELSTFKCNGGTMVVEATTADVGRDVKQLQELSEQSGVYIVAGTGYYVAKTNSSLLADKSVEDIAEMMKMDLTQGADGSSILCGYIGEIGCSSCPLQPTERKVLEAACSVQAELKCPLSIHPGIQPASPFEILRIMQEAGADARKTVVDHMDRNFFDDKPKLLEFASLGCYLEYDEFGSETSLCYEGVEMPSDAQRIHMIKYLVDEGYEDRILISHDIYAKHCLTKYGGFGLSHIPVYIIPRMLEMGISQHLVDKFFIHNPREWLKYKI